jgi:FdhD protein
MQPFLDVDVVRVREGGRAGDVDRLATEEPLEIRLHDQPFAVIMRTPGADIELAAGFLFSERVLHGADDLATIEHCRDADNIMNVMLAGDAVGRMHDALAERRNVVANSSCGLCGRLTIDSLRTGIAAIDAEPRVPSGVLAGLPDSLRRSQPLFDTTGGLHAAGLFDTDGRLVTSAEDVGRHNAVDKIIGRLLMREALPLSSMTLFVSGRTSFEIVQKAWLGGIPVVGSVSAPSSLAVDLARDAGITLAGFVRDGRFNIYAHPHRIV